MKFIVVALLLCTVDSVRVASRRDASKDRTITQVVKLLQGMLEASRADADKEADLYATYKCYVDTQTREKTENIRKLTKQIALLTSEIEELMSSNGQLSEEVAQLKKDMADNKLARDQADKLRKDEKDAFDKLDADLTAAIQQLKDAIDALGTIGADQNLADGEVSADHEQFMAGYEPASLLKVKAEVKKALLLSKAFVTSGQRQKYGSFLQTPFTGAYMSQSGEVVGILKNMLETFESNLKAAKEAEEKAIETHAAFIKTKTEEYSTMDQSYQDKQSELAANDLELTAKKGLHTTAVTQKADDEAFLEKLEPMAAQKAKEWQARQMWRANEDAAISEAIAILDSDKSFKAFGAVEATKTGATGFLQIASSEQRLRGSAKDFLQQAARSMHSKRLAGVAAMLSKGNPFTVVLEAIEGVKKNIKEEGKVDKEKKEWCEEERKVNNKNLDDKKAQIVSLTAAVDGLDDTINNAQTGLKVTIENTEKDLEDNHKSQEDETKTRKDENEEYQREAGECEDAEAILKQAIEILNRYYDDMAASYEKEIAGFVQKRQDPTPPKTWDAADGYAGQGDQGNKVIEMLEFVVKETQKEATALHDGELTAQHAYEDSMKALTDTEEKLQSDLVKLKKDLADAEEELEAKSAELKQTEKEKKAIEEYLESIKPGCDFITDNFADRETARGKELAALDTAIDKLKGTAGYTKAVTKEKHADWEEQGCKEICLEGEDHANCKACLSEVSVPGYCAGHPGTTGC